MAYYDNFNPALLQAIEPGARRVLEVGCGAGGLARAVRQQFPDIHYAGIELSEEQLQLASDVLDVSIQRNLDLVTDWSLDQELQSKIPLNSFDHIIFGDVLEHLYEPQKVLDQAAARLRPGGSALLCIPNVQHWSVFVQLILGSWPRADEGLFDRTHIRWFTLDDMLALVAEAGLVAESVQERVFAEEEGREVLYDLEDLARTLGVDPQRVMQRGLPLQYVIVGRKPA
jgi:SAM-dependent methyltransferase